MKQTLSGTVVSSKTSKTIVVAVKSTKVHPKYLKRFTTVKKYLVHNESNAIFENGTNVKIISCSPKSKLKRWEIVITQ
jgi:small subunit ribosomal protein S17